MPVTPKLFRGAAADAGKVCIINAAGEAEFQSLSGDVTVTSAGVVAVAADATDLALTTGSMLIGAAGVSAEIVVKTAGSILVGNGTTAALTDFKTSGQVLAGNGTTAISAPLTGDVTATHSGGNLVTAIGAGKVLSSMVEESLIRYADVQLTNAQMLALRASPITLVASPGANKALLVHGVYGVYTYAVAAYTESADNIAIEYAGGTDVVVLETTGWIDQAASSNRFIRPDQSTAAVTLVANEAIRAFNNGDGEFGGGNAGCSLSLRVYYSVVDTIAFT